MLLHSLNLGLMYVVVDLPLVCLPSRQSLAVKTHIDLIVTEIVQEKGVLEFSGRKCFGLVFDEILDDGVVTEMK